MEKINRFLQNLLNNCRLHFVITSLLSIHLFIQHSRIRNDMNNLNQELSNKNKLIDSLKSELFIKDIDIGRYDYILELIGQENPELLEKIMHETE
jgi:hypothetical protein